MKSVQKLLSRQGTLAQLKEQLKAQQTLTEEVRKQLPEPLNRQLQGAVLKARRLTLLVNSPVWASRLRYQAPQLQRQLRQNGLAVDQVVPRIVPERGKPPSRRRARARPLSAQNAELLRQTAEALEPGPLQEAMLRLSRRQG